VYTLILTWDVTKQAHLKHSDDNSIDVDHADIGTTFDVDDNVSNAVVDDIVTIAPADANGLVSNDDGSDNESVVVKDCDVEPSEAPAEGMQRLPDNTCLSTESVFHLLCSSTSDSIHKAVPRGRKDLLLHRRQQG